MKNLLFGVTALLLMTCCSGNGTSEKTNEDSVRIADSIAQVEAAQAAAEQAHLDSLRADSIKKAEADVFFNKLPDPKKIVWDGKAGNYLKKLGFSGTTHRNDEDYEEAEGTYILTDGYKTCKVHFTTEFNIGDTEITITGDEDALNKFYKRASKMKCSYEEGGTTVEKKGNTVYISSFGA